MRIPIATLLLVLATLLVRPAPAAACQCVSPGVPNAVRAAKHVFVGRIVREIATKIDSPGCRRNASWCAYSYRYELEVESLWKGNLPARITVDAGHGRGDCSLGRLRHTRYVFFTHGSDANPYVRACAGTRPATSNLITRVTRILGAPTAPAAPAATP
jgi:hypothetical protein